MQLKNDSTSIYISIYVTSNRASPSRAALHIKAQNTQPPLQINQKCSAFVYVSSFSYSILGSYFFLFGMNFPLFCRLPLLRDLLLLADFKRVWDTNMWVKNFSEDEKYIKQASDLNKNVHWARMDPRPNPMMDWMDWMDWTERSTTYCSRNYCPTSCAFVIYETCQTYSSAITTGCKKCFKR